MFKNKMLHLVIIGIYLSDAPNILTIELANEAIAQAKQKIESLEQKFTQVQKQYELAQSHYTHASQVFNKYNNLYLLHQEAPSDETEAELDIAGIIAREVCGTDDDKPSLEGHEYYITHTLKVLNDIRNELNQANRALHDAQDDLEAVCLREAGEPV